MQSPRVASDPFALILDPQAVVQAMEASERLRRLHSRVCRPLDRVSATAATPGAAPTDGEADDDAPLDDANGD